MGVLGLALSSYVPFIHDHDASKDLVHGLGEAAIIAGILGFIVERPLRRMFAKDIAKDVFLTLFGINAPSEYVEGLEAVCRTDRLSYNVIWQIHADWHEPGRVVRLQMEARNTLHNIGSTSFTPHALWIMGSADGAPGSRFKRVQAEVFDARGSTNPLPSLSEAQLASYSEDRTGPISIPIEDLFGDVKVPPGGRWAATVVGEVYLGEHGIVPLVQRYPALHITFLIDGAALDDLDFAVKSGTAPLAQQARTDGRLQFETDSLALPGATFRLEFSKR